MSETVLITGGNGFIGKNVVVKLLQLNYKLVLLTRSGSNISNSKNVHIEQYDTTTLDFSNIFKKYKIDFVLHMAANTNKQCSYIDSIDSNIKFPIALVTSALQFNVKYFLNMDTTFYNSELNSYSLSKKQFKEWLKTKKNKISIVNLRVDNVYGKRDNGGRFIPTVIASLINKDDKLNLTDGIQRRDFIYIDDFTSLICRVVQRLYDFDSGFYEYDAGSGKQTSIKSLVLLIEKIVDINKTKLNFGAVSYHIENEQELYSKIDISNTVKDFNWTPVVTLKEGLKEVVSYYKETND
jgi:CDP-paratose synthetase